MGDVNVRELPELWKDEEDDELTGTAPCHLEVDEPTNESHRVLPDDTTKGPIHFTVGLNSRAQIMVGEMAKLESRRLLSLDVDKWGTWTCYDDVSGDSLDPALVEIA